MASKKKKNHKNKYKKNNYGHLIALFSTTLLLVVSAGVGMLFVHKWVTVDTAAIMESEYSHIKISVEAIPVSEGATQEEATAAIEAAVEEVKQTNERYADQIADEAFLEANNIYVKDAKLEAGEGVRVTFAGDILFDQSYSVMNKLKENGGEITSGIDPALIKIMQDSDIMMLNNEFPYSTGGTPTEGKTYTFRADPSTVSYLSDMDVDLVSLANNHAYDFGGQAFLDTMDTLDNAGIAYVGAGHDINEASSAVYYIVNNLKIGFLSATQIEKGDSPDTLGATDSRAGVFRCWNNEKLLAKISEVKNNCDFLVVYIHWGTESTSEIDWAQQEQAPQMVNAGADLIIGDHPHVLQPISAMNGVPIVYSLGNFWFNSKELDTCMVQATITENGLSGLQFIPCKQSGYKTRLSTGDEALQIISYMQSISPKVTIDQSGFVHY